MNPGYSQTPLAKKLGIKEGYKMLVYNTPSHYFKLFSDLPTGLELSENPKPNSLDFIHLFCQKKVELTQISRLYKSSLKKGGLLWVSWPKGTSNLLTDLKRDFIREHFLSIGLVDIKVAAIDENWSGLKFVYRLVDR